MIQKLANTTGILYLYTPRHAVRPYAPRHAALQLSMRERARIILRRIDRAMDEEMTGAAKLLCASLAGLVFGPLLFFCYFG